MSRIDNKCFLIKSLCWSYAVIGCVGGATLGYISLGGMGLIFGIAAGILTSLAIKKGINFLQSVEN